MIVQPNQMQHKLKLDMKLFKLLRLGMMYKTSLKVQVYFKKLNNTILTINLVSIQTKTKKRVFASFCPKNT